MLSSASPADSASALGVRRLLGFGFRLGSLFGLVDGLLDRGGDRLRRPLFALGGDVLLVDELEIRHLRRVALPRADLHDSRVAAGAILEERSDVGEQLVHDVARAQESRRLATCMQVAATPERDHLLGDRLHCFRLGDGRLDAAVLDQRTGKVRVERLAVRRVAAELLP